MNANGYRQGSLKTAPPTAAEGASRRGQSSNEEIVEAVTALHGAGRVPRRPPKAQRGV